MPRHVTLQGPVASMVDHILYQLCTGSRQAVLPPGRDAVGLLAACCRVLRQLKTPYRVKWRPRRVKGGRVLVILEQGPPPEAPLDSFKVINESLPLYINVAKAGIYGIEAALLEAYRPYRDEALADPRWLLKRDEITPWEAAVLTAVCRAMKVYHAVRWSPSGAVLLVDKGELRKIPEEVKRWARREAEKTCWFTFCVKKVRLADYRISVG